MIKETGRNDPCPCGSGKKFKACCWAKSQPSRRKLSAKVLSGKMDLMERTFRAAAPTGEKLSGEAPKHKITATPPVKSFPSTELPEGRGKE